MEFIIHDNNRVLNRIKSELAIVVPEGQFCVESIGDMDGKIGDKIEGGIVISKPSKVSPWQTWDDDSWVWVISPEDQFLKDEYDAEVLRKKEFEEEKEAGGMKKASLETANNYIDARMDSGTTIATLREECRKVFKKIIPYLLN